MPKKIQARKSAIHGNGVFAVAPIKQGERVIQYKGLLRSHGDVDADDSGDVESGHTFLFTLNDDWVIDANYKGNDARWINHSCDPNCEAVIEEDEDGDSRGDKVFIEALRDIKAGEELTYNYGVDKYELGTAYGHIALEVPNAAEACERIRAAGGKVTREAGPVKGGTTVIAFVEDPDGYKIELIERHSTRDAARP